MTSEPTIQLKHLGEETLAFRVKRADQAIMARKADAIRPLDLTVPQCMVLGQLLDGVAKSCTQLARDALVTSQTMTGIVHNLEAKGLVGRRSSPDHGRVVLMFLTPEGEHLAKRAHRLATAIDDDLSKALSDDERAQLLRLLDRIGGTAPSAGA